MIDFTLASPYKGAAWVRAATAAAALTAALTMGGCASAPASPLREHHDQLVRELTMQCYWQHDGERFVYGGMAVHSACRHWAQERTQVRVPVADGLTLY